MQLGRVDFIRGRDSQLFVGQHFNPAKLPRSDREAIAEMLREIASNIETDKFEVSGKLVTFKAPAEINR